jgi:phosphoribosylformylglycinamidine cyclo-ligase
MVVIVAADKADAALAQLQAAGETVNKIGVIRAREGDEHQTIVA